MDWREMTLVAEALEYATKAHEGQYRKGEAGIPYIAHPIAVADTLWACGERSPIILAAALLHDTVEDCGVTHAQLVHRFGPAVAGIVMEVTDAPGLRGRARKDAQVEKAPHLSNGAKRVKKADKKVNMTDIVENPPGWAPSAIRGYVADAVRVSDAMGPVCVALDAAFDAVVARVLASVEGA